MNIVYFQPKGIKPEYVEIGYIPTNDKDYVWYLNDPCKELISNVKIISSEKVFFNKKEQIYKIKKDDGKNKQ